MEGGNPKGFVISIYIRPKANAPTVVVCPVKSAGQAALGVPQFGSS